MYMKQSFLFSSTIILYHIQTEIVALTLDSAK